MVTLNDEYPMQLANMLIDLTLGHVVVSLMDGNVSYNHVYIDAKDTSKTTFQCPSAIRTFEFVIIPF